MDLVNSRTTALLVISLYIAMSLVAFVAFAVDKRRARVGAWRIKEQTLQGIALAGGWPGAWAGIFALRHKTHKTAFKGVLAFITAVHLVLWGFAVLEIVSK